MTEKRTTSHTKSIILLAIPFILLGKSFIPGRLVWMLVGAVCSGLSLLPHELLHAVCYKEDVSLYTDFAHGLMFVIGTEDMGKWHFVLMCLCPGIAMPASRRIGLVWNHMHGNGLWRLFQRI